MDHTVLPANYIVPAFTIKVSVSEHHL